MQAADPQALVADLFAQHPSRVEFALSPDVRGAGEPAQRLVVVGLRQQMRPGHALQLQPMFEETQELVRRTEIRGVVASDVTARGERGQRVDGRHHAQVLVHPAVHHLQELDRELDVAQTAAPEFEVALALVLGEQGFDAASHLLHLGHEVGPLGRLPHHRFDRGDVIVGELHVAGHRPGLEQRLELPGLGPPFVVGHMRFQGSGQRSGLPLGP